MENEIGDMIRLLLLALADGQYKCDVTIPNFRDVKAEIIALDFLNIQWKPVKVRFLESIKQEETYFEDNVFAEGRHPVKKWVSYKEDWVQISWLKNYSK